MKPLTIDDSTAVLYSIKIIDEVATPEWVSQNAVEITGFNLQQIIQPGWWNQRIHPDDQQIESDVNLKLINEGYLVYEYRILFADDTYHWVRDEMRIIHHDDKSIIEILGVWRDITEDREQKALAQIQSERLRFVFEATGDGFWDWDIQKQELIYSDNCWRQIGLSPSDNGLFPASLWHERVHPDDALRVETITTKILAGETPFYDIEYRLRHTNGQWVWILARGKVVRYNRNKQATRVIGINSNITKRKETERLSEENKHNIQMLAEQVPGMLYKLRLQTDGSYHFSYISQHVKKLYNVSAESVMKDATLLMTNVHPHDIENLQKSLSHSAKNMTLWHHAHRVIDENGSEHWPRGEAAPELADDGSIVWYGYKSDITAERQAEHWQRLTASVFKHTHEGIMLTDLNKVIIEVNPMFTEITGYTRDEVLGQPVSILASGKHNQLFYQQMDAALNKEGVWKGEIWNKNKYGDLYCERKTISTIYDDQGKPTQYVGLFSDITEFKRQQSMLQTRAHFDALTKLPNRTLFIDRLTQALASAVRNKHSVSVLYIDLDDFKPVNDKFGHATGDIVLQTVASHLQANIRDTDTAARMGGDEFVLMLAESSKTHSLDVSQRLLKAINQPIPIDNKEVFISASVGISYNNTQEDSAEELIAKADTAMYKAKKEGRNKITIYGE